jgi:SAM-dependent MidA family methyltransferase
MTTRHSDEMTSDTAGARLPSRLPSFAEFVDDALFHPAWGYYSRGGVRFGEGGHYDTYPLALSPLFGRMVAQYAHRVWRRRGEPDRFEICELGAGNGQLCLDALLWVFERGRHEPSWQRFAKRSRYRIVERSPALIERQRARLGPLADQVRWSRGDLSQARLRGMPFAEHGLIIANEVLDCLPHHKVVPQRHGPPAAAFVIAELGGRRLDRARLAAVLGRQRRPRIRFRELLLPLDRVSGLAAFLDRHYPELANTPPRRYPPYFAAPRLEVLQRNATRCYQRGEALWMDYGARREFHLSAPERRKLFAGPPRSGAQLFDAPGEHDITFMVDFSVTADAARAAGCQIVFFGPQGELARRARVRLGAGAVETIIRHRALTWMLALVGAHPERTWRRGAMTWTHEADSGRIAVRRYAQRAVREFLSPRSRFQLLITRWSG